VTPLAALVQLPVPDARPEAARSNVPLAAGYLAAAMQGASVIAPRLLQDHGGDAAILAWLDDLRPTVVGFTTYLWNVERNRWLAREIKRRSPEAIVVLGGPEVAPGHPMLEPGAAPEVDTFVIGEGETSWPALLTSLAAGHAIPRVNVSGEIPDVRSLANPYVTGTLPIGAGDSVFLETVRGCTRRCDYCYYAKAAPTLRSFGPEVIPRVFELTREGKATDLYVMDPCFNAAKDFREKLAVIAEANASRIALHTELELEAVTEEVAELLARAGFVSVEAGLQSTNREALRAVHRGFRRAEFVRGASLLRDRGIAVRTGVILGLPRDTMEGFLHSVEFVKDNGLAEGVEVYPLSVLPGTDLRARAGSLGMEYMTEPPYWVLSNGAMREPDFVEALEIAEAAFDIDFFQPILPRFGNPWPGLARFRDLRAPGAASRFLAEIRSSPALLASSLSLLVAGPAPREPAELAAIGREVIAASPHTTVQIVVEHDGAPPYEPWARVATAYHVPGHYLDRIHYYATDAQERFSVRLLHLTGDAAVAERYFTDADAPAFDVILTYSRELLAPGSVLDRLVPLLVTGRLGDAERGALTARYRGAEGLIVYDRA
jgi:hypothetical protein